MRDSPRRARGLTGDAVYDPTDPGTLSEGERADEVAAILARGYLRHRWLRVAPSTGSPPLAEPPVAPESPRSRENELDAPGDQSVHVLHAEQA